MSDNYIPISYDYSTLYQNIFTKLQQQSEWSNISENDTLLQLLNTILTTKETGLFAAINNTFVDFFPNVSSADELVYMFADYIKMTVNGVLSATMNETFYLASSYSLDIIIPSGTQVSNGNITYTTLGDAVLQAGNLSIDIPAVQGVWKYTSNVSDGSNYQQYFIYVENDTSRIQVTVNGTPWTLVNNFFYSTSTDKVYAIKIVYNGVYVLFNDGVFGAKPLSGDMVVVTYLQSMGSSGNIYSSGTVTTLASQIFDINHTNVTNLISVTNNETATDGYDGDTVATIQ
ncbi:MAG: hypothetical protein ABSG25_13845, partial [Bryobacteraceae bacterium]